MAEVHSTDEAMNAVLREEEVARKAIAACESEAALRLNAARVEARRIAERAVQRIGRIHGLCSAKRQRQVQDLLTEMDQQTEPLPQEALLEKAVSALAARLTGDEGSESNR